jgi:hypothetical protein
VEWCGHEIYQGANDPPASIDGVPGFVISRIEESAQNYELQFQRFTKLLSEYVCRFSPLSIFLSTSLSLRERRLETLLDICRFI